jgi:N-acyl homoserine lactone hydrolase
MLAGKVDGVSPHEHVSIATLEAIKGLARIRPTVYLPTHDPESAARLANRSRPGALQPEALRKKEYAAEVHD